LTVLIVVIAHKQVEPKPTIKRKKTNELMTTNRNPSTFGAILSLATYVALLARQPLVQAQQADMKALPNAIGIESPSSNRQIDVRVNGRSLTTVQLAEIERTYHTLPKSGSYWYDRRSGLYGVIGGPAMGLISAGPDWGNVSANASGGDTVVYINGRRIPYVELLAWGAIVGGPVQPGRYWLDGQGNAGREGSFVPIVNIHNAGTQTASGGSKARRSILSTWDKTGTAVFGGVGVLTKNGSWYPGQ
jgi:hypothetical protein